MEKITDKWRGMRVTLNYFGETNNKFGLKKKKILLEEDKIQSLSTFRNTNNIKLQRLKKNKLSIDYMINYDLIRNNYNNNNFELIKIKDFEKTKNINFFNYFKNMKYFNRINSYKRLLSSSQNSNMNNNYKNFLRYEENEDIIVKKKKLKNKNKTSIKLDNININNKKRKEFRLSKVDINKIITNYIQEYENDIRLFNQKNKNINNKMIIQNHIRLNSQIIKKNISKSTNRKKENINNDKRNNSINKSSNYVSLKDLDNEINSNYMFQNKLFNLKNNIENKNKNKNKNNNNNIKEAIIISKKNFFYNNANFRHRKERLKLPMKKISTSIDASTNTDFYKMK